MSNELKLTTKQEVYDSHKMVVGSLPGSYTKELDALVNLSNNAVGAIELKTELEATRKERDHYSEKAKKWDALKEKIAYCYGKEVDGKWVENEDEDIDLGDIGEIAATAFGYL